MALHRHLVQRDGRSEWREHTAVSARLCHDKTRGLVCLLKQLRRPAPGFRNVTPFTFGDRRRVSAIPVLTPSPNSGLLRRTRDSTRKTATPIKLRRAKRGRAPCRPVKWGPHASSPSHGLGKIDEGSSRSEDHAAAGDGEWVAIVKDRAGGRAEAHERGRKVKARMRGTYDSKGAARSSTGGARVCASNHMRRMSPNGSLWNTTSRASLWRKRSNVEGLLSVFQLLGSKFWFSQSRYTARASV